jgi:hypothetical protein
MTAATLRAATSISRLDERITPLLLVLNRSDGQQDSAGSRDGCLGNVKAGTASEDLREWF